MHCFDAKKWRFFTPNPSVSDPKQHRRLVTSLVKRRTFSCALHDKALGRKRGSEES